MKNFEIARLFELMADVLEVLGDNPFRIRAYRRAARSVESLTEDVERLARAERLDDVPGIGRDLAGKIVEYLRTGHIADIDAARRRVPAGVVEQRKYPAITVLAGSECDILPDGTLDYPDHVLAGLDLVVGAVHTRFTLTRAQMTRRLCAALASPHLHVLAHPTGRLLGEREAYAVDLDRVLDAARRHGKAVEINAQPQRLDLDDVHARRAHELRTSLAIDTDAHVADQLGYVELGVWTARRGWVGPAEVVNTWPVDRLLGWIRGTRRAA